MAFAAWGAEEHDSPLKPDGEAPRPSVLNAVVVPLSARHQYMERTASLRPAEDTPTGLPRGGRGPVCGTIAVAVLVFLLIQGAVAAAAALSSWPALVAVSAAGGAIQLGLLYVLTRPLRRLARLASPTTGPVPGPVLRAVFGVEEEAAAAPASRVLLGGEAAHVERAWRAAARWARRLAKAQEVREGAALVVDETGRIASATAAAKKLFRLHTSLRLDGQPLFLAQLVSDFNVPGWLSSLAQGAVEGVSGMEATCVSTDGTSFSAELRAVQIQGGDGLGSEDRPLFYVDVVRSGTLGGKDKRLSLIMEMANDAIIVMNVQSTITAFNRAAEAMFGWPAEEAVGQTIEILMSKLYGSMHHRAVRRYIAGGAPRVIGRLRETTGVRRSGASFPIELSVSESMIGGSRLFIGSIRDMSERRKGIDELEDTKSRYQNLLLNILPAPVAKELLEDRPLRSVAQRFEDVVVLFADIVGFTKISEVVDPAALVETLNGVFTKFDALCEHHGLEKIKTIGDAYMCCSGLPFPIPGHVEAAADMALDMLEALESVAAITVKAADGEEEEVTLQIRVGMNIGTVVAGVIGTKKLAYDVWGDSVNTASRMESTGAAGRVHVTAAVRERLAEWFDFEERAPIEVKGKGLMQTHFLLARRARKQSTDGSVHSSAAAASVFGLRSLILREGGAEPEAADRESVGGSHSASNRGSMDWSRRRSTIGGRPHSTAMIRAQEDSLARTELEQRDLAGSRTGFAFEAVSDPAFSARSLLLFVDSEARRLVEKFLRMLGLEKLIEGRERELEAFVQELAALPYPDKALDFHHALQSAHQFAVLVRGIPRIRRFLYPGDMMAVLLSLLTANCVGAVRVVLDATRAAIAGEEGAAAKVPLAETSKAASASVRMAQERLAEARAAGRMISPPSSMSLLTALAAAGREEPLPKATSMRLRRNSGGAQYHVAILAEGEDEAGGRTPPSPPRARLSWREPPRAAPAPPPPPPPPVPSGPNRRASLGLSSGAEVVSVFADMKRTAQRTAPSAMQRRGPAERVASLLVQLASDGTLEDDMCAAALCACLEASQHAAPEILGFILHMEKSAGDFEALKGGAAERSWTLGDEDRRRLCVLLFHFCRAVDVYKFPAVAERTTPAFVYRLFPELLTEEMRAWIAACDEKEGGSDGVSSVGDSLALARYGTGDDDGASLGLVGAVLPGQAREARVSISSIHQPRTSVSSLRVSRVIPSATGNPLAKGWPEGAAAKAAAGARARKASKLDQAQFAAWQAAAEHCIGFLDILVGPLLHVTGELIEEVRDEEAKLEQARELWRRIAFASHNGGLSLRPGTEGSGAGAGAGAGSARTAPKG